MVIKYKYLLIVYIMAKLLALVQLYFFIIISLNLVDKYSKCKKKILKFIKFVCYVSNMPLIFLYTL